MIRYRLQCKKKHEFEAWFSSSAAYDTQAKSGQVTCPDCGSTKVSKTLMKPGVSTRSRKARGGEETSPAPVSREELSREEQSQEQRMPATVAAAAGSEKQAEMQRQFLAMLQHVRKEVEKTADYVGPKFAEEARKIHLEEVEPRRIWGEATLEEARDLVEDGIEVLPLPRLPKDAN